MKYLKYILIIFILILTPNVFASEYNMNSHSSATLGGTTNRYRATEIYNTGTSHTYTFGTQYSGRISDIETYFSYPFVANTTYTLTYNMNTEDFRNNFGSSYWWDCDDDMTSSNSHVVSVSYISYKKVKVSFKPTSNTMCIRMWLRSTNLSSTAITGVSNWRLNSITIYDPEYQSGSSGGQGSSSTPTPTPTPTNDYSSIINNQNNNTQDIINNNNQNTQDIIENNNQNTQDIIDNMSDDCKNLMDLNEVHLIRDTSRTLTYDLPSTLSAGTYTLSYDYYSLFNPTVSVQVYLIGQSSNYVSVPLSNSGKSTFTTDFTFNRMYFLISNSSSLDSQVQLTNLMLVNGSSSLPYCSYGSKVNKIDETNKNLNEINNALNDNSDPSISDNDFLTTFNSIGLNDPLSYLLTLPTQLINKIVSLSDTCSPVNLGSLYGTMITLPCLNLESILGSSIWGTIDVIFSVSLLVVILKNLYDTFSNLLTMGAEKEAKEKFSMPTPMDFLSMILGGDR